MTQVMTNIFEGVDLIGTRTAARNQCIAQSTIATGNVCQGRRILHADFIAQIIGNALHARPIILESLTGLAAGCSSQQAQTTTSTDAVHDS